MVTGFDHGTSTLCHTLCCFFLKIGIPDSPGDCQQLRLQVLLLRECGTDHATDYPLHSTLEVCFLSRIGRISKSAPVNISCLELHQDLATQKACQHLEISTQAIT